MQISEYQRLAQRTAVYRENLFPENWFIYSGLGLSGEAGEVANKLKKVIRDDDNMFTPERLNQISAELGGVLWYLAVIAEDLGLSLEEIADQNLQILYDRLNRDVIKGDGDDR